MIHVTRVVVKKILRSKSKIMQLFNYIMRLYEDLIEFAAEKTFELETLAQDSWQRLD